MTREEAIKFLKGYLDEEVYTEKCRNAHKMAIKALEKEPILDKIRAEIEAIIGEHNLDDYDFCSGLICARNIIDRYKAESEE
jgi:hypothetical protein